MANHIFQLLHTRIAFLICITSISIFFNESQYLFIPRINVSCIGMSAFWVSVYQIYGYSLNSGSHNLFQINLIPFSKCNHTVVKNQKGSDFINLWTLCTVISSEMQI